MIEEQKRERVYNGFLKIDKVTFQHQRYDGTTSEILTREVVERNDAITALLYLKEEDVYLFVEQVRIPTLLNGTGFLVECVAGLIDKGETGFDALQREVKEEVGYEIDNIQHLSTFYSTPGGCSEKVELYYADLTNKITNGGGLFSEGEDIKIVKYSLSDLKQMYFDKKIDDAKTLIAVQWLLLNNN
ncbi:NUDIX hydrolase [Flammeovirga pectinis]|uniref:GDP-mannose pyrophosphatase n=1 Tax=Flammeovirga pectinis TaxID=2494373 RepID=A0A3Q9FKB3_9BACT|nr:NUDIX hydrolase [Flammeovirga pectinis]AZQ61657.1 NUDIX hydrolase [Flammeovirga pectinis]